MGISKDIARIDALLFDVFGTVVDWRSGISREVAAFFDRHAIEAAPAQFADEWRALYQPAMEAVRAGQRGFVKLDVLHFENLKIALANRNVDPAQFSPSELTELNLAWHRLDAWPDSVEGLRRLRERHLIAPLSNGNVRLLTDMAKRARLPWDCILGAEVVQGYKPDPRVYADTAAILDRRPEECLFVAAHNDDLEAAARVGFRTAFVCRPMEHGSAQTIDLKAEGPWDYVATDMCDLADKLSF